MITLLFIALGISIAGYYFSTIIFILINRKKFSEKLPEQLKVYRWIYAFTIALIVASLFTLAFMEYSHLSEIYLYIIWAGLFLLSFAAWYIYAKHTITEWFIPNRKLPQLPIRYFPKNKRSIIVLIIFATIIVLLLYGNRF